MADLHFSVGETIHASSTQEFIHGQAIPFRIAGAPTAFLPGVQGPVRLQAAASQYPPALTAGGSRQALGLAHADLALAHAGSAMGLAGFQGSAGVPPRRRFHAMQVTSLMHTSDDSSGISASRSAESFPIASAMNPSTLCPQGDEHVDALLSSLMSTSTAPQRRPPPPAGAQAAARKLQRAGSTAAVEGPLAAGPGMPAVTLVGTNGGAGAFARGLAHGVMTGSIPGFPSPILHASGGPVHPLPSRATFPPPNPAFKTGAYCPAVPAQAFNGTSYPQAPHSTSPPALLQQEASPQMPSFHAHTLGMGPGAVGMQRGPQVGAQAERPPPPSVPPTASPLAPAPVPSPPPSAPLQRQLSRLGPTPSPNPDLAVAADAAADGFAAPVPSGAGWVAQHAVGAATDGPDVHMRGAGECEGPGASEAMQTEGPGGCVLAAVSNDAEPEAMNFAHQPSPAPRQDQPPTLEAFPAGRPQAASAAEAAAHQGSNGTACGGSASSGDEGADEPGTYMERSQERSQERPDTQGARQEHGEEDETTDSEAAAAKRRARKRTAQRGRVGGASAASVKKEMCRERNRSAQRRFRERQRELIRALQDKVDEQEALIAELRSRLAGFEGAQQA